MKQKNLRILAIESSCDETSAAIIEGSDSPVIKSNIIASQIDLHKITGGVVPEVAARAHCEAIIPVIEQSLAPLEIELFGKKSDQTIRNVLPYIDAIAVTVGPGLVGSLLVGVETAKALAFAGGKPLIPVNHLEGHIFAAMQQVLNSKPEVLLRQAQDGEQSRTINSKQTSNLKVQNSKQFEKLDISKLNIVSNLEFRISNLLPAIALLVSGGHTELVLIKDMFDYEIIGQTLDDAAGEAFDKVASLLGLEYPGGPAISALAEEFVKNSKSQTPRLPSTWHVGQVNSKQIKSLKLQTSNLELASNLEFRTSSFKLPRPMLKSGDLNFSFSGLKTAVVNLVKQLESNRDGISSQTHLGGGGAKRDLLRGEKQAIAYEFQEAVAEVLVEKSYQAYQKLSTMNYKLSTILLTGGVSANKRLRQSFKERFGDKLLISPVELCGDNAGMIGLAAFYRYKKQIINNKSQISNKFQIQNSKPILKSIIYNLKSAFPWKAVDVDPNLEL